MDDILLEEICPVTDVATATLAIFTNSLPITILIGSIIFLLLARKKTDLLFWSYIFFVIPLTLWLGSNLVLWLTTNPQLVVPAWSLLDLLSVITFVFAALFWYRHLHRNTEGFPLYLMLGSSALILIQLGIMLSGNGVHGFSPEDCEAIESDVSVYFTLFVQLLVLLYIFFGALFGKKTQKGGGRYLFSLSLLVFLGFLTLAPFVASVTELYDLELYAFLILPILIIPTITLTLESTKSSTGMIGTLAVTYMFLATILFQVFVLSHEELTFIDVAVVVTAVALCVLVIRNVAQQISLRHEKEKLVEDLAIANDRLKELDQTKSEFLSIASHQLRAPITAVRGYAANIVEGDYGPVPENLKEPLATVQETARLMVNSIEDYLNISRIEQGRMKYEKSQFDIADLAKKVVTELTPVAAKRSLSLKADAPEDLMVNADIGKIKQVIVNLVDNAIKYTKEGSVTVSVALVDKKARVTITDTGVGIAPDEITGLFEKFKRARGANKVNTTGTGLGLYVAKQLTEGHGGRVWAESDGAGKGSRFIIELPL